MSRAIHASASAVAALSRRRNHASLDIVPGEIDR
jgi:hypothetical protein